MADESDEQMLASYHRFQRELERQLGAELDKIQKLATRIDRCGWNLYEWHDHWIPLFLERALQNPDDIDFRRSEMESLIREFQVKHNLDLSPLEDDPEAWEDELAMLDFTEGTDTTTENLISRRMWDVDCRLRSMLYRSQDNLVQKIKESENLDMRIRTLSHMHAYNSMQIIIREYGMKINFRPPNRDRDRELPPVQVYLDNLHHLEAFKGAEVLPNSYLLKIQSNGDFHVVKVQHVGDHSLNLTRHRLDTTLQVQYMSTGVTRDWLISRDQILYKIKNVENNLYRVKGMEEKADGLFLDTDDAGEVRVVSPPVFIESLRRANPSSPFNVEIVKALDIYHVVGLPTRVE